MRILRQDTHGGHAKGNALNRIDRFEEIDDGLRRARALKRWVELDIAFHRLLVESSGLSPLLSFNDLLAAFFRRFRESVKKTEWKAGIESHQRIIDALRASKMAEAREELRRHVESHRERLEVVS